MSELEERSPPHSSHPFGNEGFELLRQGALTAERASPPEAHGESPPEEPSPEELRDRRIRALEADVAALRCSLARIETMLANLTGGR